MICPICLGTNVFSFQLIGFIEYFRCKSCLGLFTDPESRLSPEEEKERYSLHNNDVDDPEYRKFLSKLYDPLIKKLKKESRGLDYGCGPGPALASMLREEGFSVDIYDPYFFPDESYKDKVYDFITCTEAAEHFYEPQREFNKLDRVLAGKGILGVMTNFYEDTINFEDWYYRKDPTHVVFYTVKTLQCIAEERSWKLDIQDKNVVFFKK